MRISDWSLDVCSSDLPVWFYQRPLRKHRAPRAYRHGDAKPISVEMPAASKFGRPQAQAQIIGIAAIQADIAILLAAPCHTHCDDIEIVRGTQLPSPGRVGVGKRHVRQKRLSTRSGKHTSPPA